VDFHVAPKKYNHMKSKFFLLIFILTLTSCENIFDYSPYAINFSEENRDVNRKNIEKLNTPPNDDTITIAFTGDTHNFFDETEEFVEKVNQNPSVDFVIHVGDIADFGLPKQYLWANSFLLKLNAPYFVVIGNHDLVGTGAKAYQEMFGAFDFSFIYKQIKFIFINTNSLEFEYNGSVPDIHWLDAQLKPDEYFDKAIVIFHLPPNDIGFDAALADEFHRTLIRYENILFTVHGHYHGHEIYHSEDEKITFANVYGVENYKYNIIKISNNEFYVDTLEF
jgi:3',5'-cyclic AMP phosphodiesterase CpdA